MTSTPLTRPGGLTALCILAIVLGSLGLLTGLSGLVMTAVQGPLQNLVDQMQPEADEEAAQLQQRVAQETREFAERHVVRNVVLALARLLVAGGLLAGGILAMRLRAAGRKLLLFAFVAGIVFELCQIWPMVEVARFTQHIMDGQNLGGENADEDTQAAMRVMMKAIAAMQVAMLAAMVLVKTAFYGFGWWYLMRPRVESLYLPRAASEGEWR